METDNEDSLWKLIMKIHYRKLIMKIHYGNNEDSMKFTMETDNEDSLQKLIMKIHYRN